MCKGHCRYFKHFKICSGGTNKVLIHFFGDELQKHIYFIELAYIWHILWNWDTMSVYDQHRVSQPFLQGQRCDLFTYDVCGSTSNTTCSGRTL